MRLRSLLLLLPLLGTGCLPNGEWIPTLWGGATLDPAEATDTTGTFEADGCTVEVTRYAVSIQSGALLDPLTQAVAALPGDQVFDVAQPGPHSLASVFLRRGVYPESVLIVSRPDTLRESELAGRGRLVGWDNASSDPNPIRGNVDDPLEEAMVADDALAALAGTVTCGDEPIAFDLLVDDGIGLLFCPHGETWEVPGGGYAVTTYAVDAEAVLGPVARAIHDADDSDDDGVIGLSELPADDASALRAAQRNAWSTDEGPCRWERAPETAGDDDDSAE